MLKERLHLSELVNQARKRNIGVQPFVVQLEAIEDKAFSGATETELRPLVAELTKRLEDQLRQSVELKSYRPAPLTASQLQANAAAQEELDRKEADRKDRTSAREEKYRTKYKDDWGNNNGQPLGTTAKDRRSKAEKSMEESHHEAIGKTDFTINHTLKMRPTSFSEATDPKIIHTSGPSNGASAAAHRRMGW
jgi:hypothetical protein